MLTGCLVLDLKTANCRIDFGSGTSGSEHCIGQSGVRVAARPLLGVRLDDLCTKHVDLVNRVSLRLATERVDGLEAQQEAVRRHLNGGAWTLVSEVVEVESGRRNDRPKLAEALRLCRLHGATLIIAKLDRLARNVAFISNLMEAGVDFVAVAFPQANRLTVHILAAVAEHEAAAISARTKGALAAAKARGTKLGGDRGNFASIAALGPVVSRAVRSEKATSRAADVLPVIRDIQAGGVSLRQVAAELTARGIPAPRGGAWSAVQVSRVIERAKGC